MEDTLSRDPGDEGDQPAPSTPLTASEGSSSPPSSPPLAGSIAFRGIHASVELWWPTPLVPSVVRLQGDALSPMGNPVVRLGSLTIFQPGQDLYLLCEGGLIDMEARRYPSRQRVLSELRQMTLFEVLLKQYHEYSCTMLQDCRDHELVYDTLPVRPASIIQVIDTEQFFTLQQHIVYEEAADLDANDIRRPE
ncbi:hypothetical protein IAT38_005701 [Cryptococcus sp. DSM 104549]